MERARELYRHAQQPVNRSILENVLAEMRVEYRITDSDMARIPAGGPAILTANHPFGLRGWCGAGSSADAGARRREDPHKFHAGWDSRTA